MSVEKISRQLVAEKALFKYSYGNNALDPWITETLAKAIARNGCDDIRDIRLYVGPGDARLAQDVYKGYNAAGDLIGYRGFDLEGNPIDFAAPLDAAKIVPDVSYYYNVKTGKRFEGEDFGTAYDSSGVFLGVDLARYGRDFFCKAQSDDFDITITLNYTNDGLIYFYALLKRRIKDQSILEDIGEMAGPLMPIIGLALNFLVPGLGLALGTAVTGAVGVTVSASVASLIGNLAVSTALNGGDIVGAVKGQMLSFGSSLVGDFAASGTGSALVGRVAAAATSAAASGGDLKQAALSVALTTGAKEMNGIFDTIGDWFSSEPVYPLNQDATLYNFDAYDLQTVADPLVFDTPVNYDSYDFQSQFSPEFPSNVALGNIFGSNTGTLFTDSLPNSTGGYVAFQDTYDSYDFQDINNPAHPYYTGNIDLGTGVYGSGIEDIPWSGPIEAPTLPPISPSQQASGGTLPKPGATSGGDSFSWGDAVAGITAAALAAQRLVTAYQQAKNPSIIKAGTVTATGQTVVANTNGTITSRNPVTGVSNVSIPPQGVPYQTADGSLITNNGDGSYTIVRPDGTRATARYQTDSSGQIVLPTSGTTTSLFGGSNQTLIYAALGLGALLLLKGK